ncbi:primosomal protein N' (replication factor Y) - superfamily II helicase [Qingshengfaniella alkalisoli]|uniref:Primosomal protein N' (Replication factor Y)-superfamily II helicase n=1 Tax=Qingshengfaniella alkalisoli TaxID=2599296 RepID=A0A5B8I7C8_9RHOB|nr:primosomal protein N' (replication factor Y) - superfamily II helicase [Qingshengfaniella alkalisoli]QDY69645.1 primosomal protein N' (replication factor Y) - superfamily II helicase [Qingshengfaniella alkalisoli]
MPTPPPLPTGTTDTDALNDHRFPCDSCGGAMRFSPAQQQLICDHCGNTKPVSAAQEGLWGAGSSIPEMDFKSALRKQIPDADLESTQVTKCANCGASVEFDPAIHAAECPFCATPIVSDTGVDRHIKPRGILPFMLDEPSARDAVGQWMGSLWFAPNRLKRDSRRHRKMDGIYIPYWTFDAQTESRYAGERGVVYYETRYVIRDGKRQAVQVAKVRWSPARGRVARFFDDVLVLASRSLPKQFTDALQPWDLSRLSPYNAEFIAGMRAEAYTVELDEAFNEARGYMDRVIERDVRFDIGGDRQRIHQLKTEVSDIRFKHILLPIWVAAYRYRGKSYRFVVNGQSGRVQGERPYSAIKIALAVLAALALAATIGYVYAMNQGGM